MSGGAVVLLAFGALAYLLPALVAGVRNHRNAGAILALDLLLGWTFLGWAGALVWALTDNVAPRAAVTSGVGSSRFEMLAGGAGLALVLGLIVLAFMKG